MRRCASTCIALLGGLFALGASGQAPQSSAPAEEPRQEVTVSAARVLDHKALARAVSGFVETLATPGNRIAQIGRWYENVCPMVTGLQPAAQEFIAREVLDVARAVGAPTRAAGKKCSPDVEIIFTREPQALVDHIAKSYRLLLGYYPKSQAAQMMRFSRPIQAWYETATRSNNDHPGSVEGQIGPSAQLDTDQTALGWQPTGSADSLLRHGQTSEFAHVLIIADSRQVDHYPLRAIADYVALLALTRISQTEGCSPLASITDLLASNCNSPMTDALTAADRAYLKGLYSADLDKSINLERGDVHERMMRQLEKQ